jgi:hypothetical protein
MSTKFVEFTNPRTNKPVLVNPAHVRTAQPIAGKNWIELDMGGKDVAVEGDLKSVLEALTGESEHTRSLDENLPWTRRDPEVS